MAKTIFDLVGRAAGALAPVAQGLRAQNERIVIIVLADSTGRRASAYQSTSMQVGWQTGLSKALQRMGIPMCATGIYGPGPTTGAGTGYGAHGYGQNGSLNSEGASESVAAAVPAWANLATIGTADAGMDHLKPWGRTSALTYSGNFRGMILNGSDSFTSANFDGDPSPMPLIGGLNAHYLHGVDPTGGSYPVEFSVAGGAAAARGNGVVNCANPTESYGISGRTTIAIASGAANTRDFYVGSMRRAAALTPASGILKLGHAIENPARTWGYSIHTLYQLGGQSMRDCIGCLAGAHADWFKAYFSFLRHFATGAPKKIIVVPMFGFNDRNEATASYLNAYTGDSAAAFKDNFEGIRQWFFAGWDANGWSRNELFWAPTAEWQISSPDDAELIAYRTACEEIEAATPQCQSLDPMRTLDWSVVSELYDRDASNTDFLHLSRLGYDVVGHAMAMQMIGGELLSIGLRNRERW